MAGSHHQLPRDLAAQFGREALAILEGGMQPGLGNRRSLFDIAVSGPLAGFSSHM